ncbi:Astacin-like metalloprotease toxin 1 [Halotydeus destructor]|nr:Astacin-like metalloprotease toxin 1 [Halotydeus destructor]
MQNSVIFVTLLFSVDSLYLVPVQPRAYHQPYNSYHPYHPYHPYHHGHHPRLHFVPNFRAMQNPALFQGDITGPMPDDPYYKNMEMFLWPKGVIPFRIESKLNMLKPLIFEAIREIERKTCVRFVKHSNEKDFLTIQSGQGCSAHVGRLGGEQMMTLGRGCENVGIMVHELMHVIGFYHLHQRYDRDKYLHVHWNHIRPMFLSNFKLLGKKDKRVESKFDYKSIMLYGTNAFSVDQRVDTMTPTSRGATIKNPAERAGLSLVDVQSVNKLYSCGVRRPYNG